jgi:hypothetical protein
MISLANSAASEKLKNMKVISILVVDLLKN